MEHQLALLRRLIGNRQYIAAAISIRGDSSGTEIRAADSRAVRRLTHTESHGGRRWRALMRGFGVVTVTLFTCKPVLFSLVDTAPNRRSVCANSGQWWAPKIWPSVAPGTTATGAPKWSAWLAWACRSGYAEAVPGISLPDAGAIYGIFDDARPRFEGPALLSHYPVRDREHA